MFTRGVQSGGGYRQPQTRHHPQIKRVSESGLDRYRAIEFYCHPYKLGLDVSRVIWLGRVWLFGLQSAHAACSALNGLVVKSNLDCAPSHSGTGTLYFS